VRRGFSRILRFQFKYWAYFQSLYLVVPYYLQEINKEKNMPKESLRREESLHRVRIGRIAAIACAAGVIASSAFTASAFAAGTVKVATAKTTKLGTYLVSGTTLYTLNKTACSGKCLTIWPPLLLPKGATKAVAGAGVNASMLGTKSVAGGLQVTYGGKPLYWFYKDKSPGKVNGNKLKDQWGVWSIVVTVKPKAGSGGGSTTTTAPSGGGVSF
jgi:predicted lipoprotein with Yx(FWY)xxD motif